MQLVIDDVKFEYNSYRALDGVSFTLKSSEFLGIVGPNGSGKSTLLKCINKILSPKQGKILLDGREIHKMQRNEIAKIFSYVPQSSHLGFSKPTVFDVVLMGRRPYIDWKYSQEDVEKVWEILSKLKIIDFAMRRFDELSGGEQQKVLIARALAQEAKILLLDEPTSNLDIRHQIEVMDLLKEIISNNGKSVIVALHDLNLASMYCDKILMMKKGRIFAAGTPIDVFTPENIKKTFGVNVCVHNIDGRPRIFLLNNINSAMKISF
ncbi:MAG: ABC transporter ATP-binding protein [Candidatus Methanomethylicaceae archaeon]